MKPLAKFIRTATKNGYSDSTPLSELFGYITHDPHNQKWLDAYVTFLEQIKSIKGGEGVIYDADDKGNFISIKTVSFGKFKEMAKKRTKAVKKRKRVYKKK